MGLALVHFQKYWLLSTNYHHSLSDSVLNKSHLMKKLEERNVCISNAKHRWNFIKKSTLPEKKIGEDEESETTTTTGTGSSNSAKVCSV